MSFIQTLFKRILPKAWAEDMEAESRKWMIRCNGCGYQRSVWDVGGIRWRAYSVNKQIMARCPGCGQLRSAKVFKVEDSKPASFG